MSGTKEDAKDRLSKPVAPTRITKSDGRVWVVAGDGSIEKTIMPDGSEVEGRA